MKIDSLCGIYTLTFLLAGSVFVLLGFHAYLTNQVTNDIKSEIYSSINDTTSNKEIIQQIHNQCSQIPWYVSKLECENELLETFITPTKK